MARRTPVTSCSVEFPSPAFSTCYNSCLLEYGYQERPFVTCKTSCLVELCCYRLTVIVAGNVLTVSFVHLDGRKAKQRYRNVWRSICAHVGKAEGRSWQVVSVRTRNEEAMVNATISSDQHNPGLGILLKLFKPVGFNCVPNKAGEHAGFLSSQSQ